MLYTVIAVAGAAIIAGTSWLTGAEYKNLPDRVPIQYWLDGRATSFGPRPAIWLLVGVQAACAAIFTFAALSFQHLPGGQHNQLRMALFALCVLAMLANFQTMMVEAAKLPEPQLPLVRYWISFVGFMLAAIICVTLV